MARPEGAAKRRGFCCCEGRGWPGGSRASQPLVSRIDTVEVIDSSLGRRQLRLVLAWAELHQDELLENWRLARVGETLRAIEPLR